MIIDPGWQDLLMTALLFAIVVALSIREGLGMERTMFIGSLRTVTQLLLMGFVIKALFQVDLWYVIVGVLVCMTIYAASAGLSRMKRPVAGLYLPMWTGVAVGTLFTTAVVTGAVLKIEPWYRPDMLIPLGGMILGNAMTGGALAADRLYTELKSRQEEIETLLQLGWDYKRAAHESKKEAVRAAMIPTINSMMTVGIVHIPGVMAGQMLGGVSPFVAAKYQIIIMLMIASAVTITSTVFTTLALKRYFTPHQQLNRKIFL